MADQFTATKSIDLVLDADRDTTKDVFLVNHAFYFVWDAINQSVKCKKGVKHYGVKNLIPIVQPLIKYFLLINSRIF